MNLSIIIVSFNARDVTLKMYPTLKKSLDYLEDNLKYIKWEVINVDNGSTDGVCDEIENQFSDWVKIIRGENVGFSKGNNRGLSERELNSDYVLFINPDITLEKDSIHKVIQYMEGNRNVDLVTCRVDLWSGGIDIDCHRGFPKPWAAFCYFTGLEKAFGKLFPKIFGQYHLLWEDLESTHEVDVCLGAYMMIRNDVGEKLNWWPEDYMLNGEDVDLCYQIKEIHGGKIVFFPETFVVHYKGASKGTKNQSASITKASDEGKALSINSGIQAMEIFYKKYYDKKYPWVINNCVYLGIWLLKKKRLLLGKE